MDTILVIDDVDVNRELVRAHLGDQYRIVEAANGEEALRLTAQEPVDLVLLDVMMPGLDGYEVTRRIRQLRGNDLLPILLLTSLSSSEERLRGFEAGADDFITKPVEMHELRMRVRAFLRTRRLYRDREALLVEAQQLHLMKDDFVALLVHDLRNPLAALQSWLELVDFAGVSGEAHEALEGATVAAQRLRELVDDLLQARLLEDGAVQAALTSGPIEPVARAAAATVQGLAAGRQVVVRLDVPAEPLLVHHDRPLLQRALENVLINAIRHTPANASVTLRVYSDRDSVHLEVSDEGPGIPAEERPLLFSKYGSLSLRGSGNRRGHGLGLFLVGLVMQAHHGLVHAAVAPTGGTSMVMSLPLQ